MRVENQLRKKLLFPDACQGLLFSPFLGLATTVAHQTSRDNFFLSFNFALFDL